MKKIAILAAVLSLASIAAHAETVAETKYACKAAARQETPGVVSDRDDGMPSSLATQKQLRMHFTDGYAFQIAHSFAIDAAYDHPKAAVSEIQAIVEKECDKIFLPHASDYVAPAAAAPAPAVHAAPATPGRQNADGANMVKQGPAQTYVPTAQVTVDEQARNQHEPVIQAKLDNYWGPIARKSPLAYSAQTGGFGNYDIKFTTIACTIGERSGNLAVAFSNYGAHVAKVGCWLDAADGVHVTWVAANGESDLFVAPYDKLIKLQ